MSQNANVETFRTIGALCRYTSGREILDAYLSNRPSTTLQFAREEEAKTAQGVIEANGFTCRFHPRLRGFNFCHVELLFQH